MDILDHMSGHRDLKHMAQIVQSVLDSGRADELAGCTSMFDLIVVPRPVADPPYDAVAVRSPMSMRPAGPGLVRIEHISLTGRNDVIDRPVDQAVPLFWRFMIEKFGVDPGDPDPQNRRAPATFPSRGPSANNDGDVGSSVAGDRKTYGFPARLTLVGRERPCFPGFRPQLKVAYDLYSSSPVYLIGADGAPEAGTWLPYETRDVFIVCESFRYYSDCTVPLPVVELYEGPKLVATGEPVAQLSVVSDDFLAALLATTEPERSLNG